MRNIVYVLMGVLVVASMLLPPSVKACSCNCAVLRACYADCKELMPDRTTTMACDGGCLIACIWHGAS
jgi:hypothetical protein